MKIIQNLFLLLTFLVFIGLLLFFAGTFLLVGFLILLPAIILGGIKIKKSAKSQNNVVDAEFTRVK